MGQSYATPEGIANIEVRALVGNKLWKTFGADIQRFANKRLAVVDIDDLIAHLNTERIVARANNVLAIDDIISKLQHFKELAIPKAEINLREGRIMERLRPEVKPKEVSDRDWERSACDKSPTGSHYFLLSGAPPDGPCKYCGQFHSEVYMEKYLRGEVV